jgi:glucose/mannose-6-phosphate isomerase
VTGVDSTNQLAEVLGLPEHLRDALWRVDSAGIAPHSGVRQMLVAGMGGSAIGARLAAGAIGDRLTKPVGLASNYTLPPGTGPDTLVLCSSYSGNTEETLAAYDAAKAAGAPRIVSTTGGALAERARADGVPVIPLPGGFQPRHAVGYATVVALEVARLAGASPDLRGEVEEAAAGIEGFDPAEAEPLADSLHATTPVIHGADLTAPVAYRWKSQFNENAKQHAFATELPEGNHNEICPWVNERDRFTPVFLEDPGMHPRNAARMEIARDVSGGGIVVAVREGAPLARLIRLVLLGDVLTIRCALLRGEDPVTIEGIDALKARLAEDA